MSLLRRIGDPAQYLCFFCKYYINDGSKFDSTKCAVFSHFGKQIPYDIKIMRHNHHHPHHEDGGIQFEMKSAIEFQRHGYFSQFSQSEIEEKLASLLYRSTRRHDRHDPRAITNKGHLPPIWFMYDD